MDDMVSEAVVETRYFPVASLLDYEPGDPHIKQAVEYQWRDAAGDTRKITEEDGVVLTLTGRRRQGVVYRHMGREVDALEVPAIEDETRRAVPEFAAWDYRITEAVLTDGPAAKAELLESYEQKKKREGQERDIQHDATSTLAASIDKMGQLLGNTTEAFTPLDDPAALVSKLKETLTTAQLEDMLMDIKEESQPPPRKRAVKK